MLGKEGRIFIEIVCPSCGAMVKNGWNYVPKKGEKIAWISQCPVCHFPISVVFEVN